MWVWHGTVSPKNNPLALIKRQIVRYHLQKDLKRAANIGCMYTKLILTTTPYGNMYKLSKFLTVLGFFHNSKHRRFFLYSFLNTCAYSRLCPACHNQVDDVLTHALKNCPRTRTMRLTLRLKLLLYNSLTVKKDVNFGCKTSLFSYALGNRPFRKALCEFLIALGY